MPSVASESRKQAASRPSPPLPKRGVVLALLDLVQIRSQILQRLAVRLANPEVDQVVPERLPEQELDGQIVQALGILAAIALLGLQHPFHHAVPDRQRHRREEVPRGKVAPGFAQRVSDVMPDRFLDGGHGICRGLAW